MLNVRSCPIADKLLQCRECPLCANRFTSHCKKSSDLSRRQTTMKSAIDLPNGDLQNLREMMRRSA